MKQNETKKDEKGTKTDEIFRCNFCDYNTCHVGHWKRHLETKKHKKLEMKQNETNETKKDEKGTKGTRNVRVYQYSCELCGAGFGSRTTLWRHKKKCCGCNEETTDVVIHSNNKSVSEIMAENKRLREQVIEQQSKTINAMEKRLETQEKSLEIMEKVAEGVGNITNMTNCTNNITNNQNNNSFNINLFLNEKCGDALSIQDFAKRLQLTMSDLLNSKNNKALGLANIVVKNLEPLAITERPVHCTETDEWFVKDKDTGWKEDQGNTLVTEVAEHGIRQQWPDIFQSENPNWAKSELKTNEYVEIAGMAASKLTTADKKKLNKAMKKKCTLRREDAEKIIK